MAIEYSRGIKYILNLASFRNLYVFQRIISNDETVYFPTLVFKMLEIRIFQLYNSCKISILSEVILKCTIVFSVLFLLLNT